jgi:precorrin-6Y C5,15-methyltransferase (decarboxylating)
MKHPLLLPGIAPPKAAAERDAEREWPPVADMLSAVAQCDLPSAGKTPSFREAAAANASLPLPPVTVLGMGLETSLPPGHLRILETSEVVAAGEGILERLGRLEAEKIPLRAPVREALELVLARREEGRRVAVAADGDPLFFGVGATLAKILPPDALRILPGVSSLQEACARARLPWHDVFCVSLHGRNDFTRLSAAVLSERNICLLTDGDRRPDLIARFLLDRGVDWYAMHVFENMGGEREKTQSCELASAAGIDFGPACTVLLTPNAPPRRARFGLDDAAPASEGGLFTKGPVRAAAVAALRIAPQHLVWDLGAGSGIVALEASVLAHRGTVFAVEQNPARVLCIEENRRRFGAANLEIVHGAAPDCLAALPDPDAVFLGGGISDPENFRPLLDAVCSRLKADGRLCISCVLLNSLERARAFLGGLRWKTEIACVQVSEAGPLGNDQRLAALNPVFLVSAAKRTEG